MAIFRPSTLIGAVSGTVGGVNFALTRSGPVARRPLLRVNQSIPAQVAPRRRFAQVTRGWAALADEQRAAWRESALLVNRTNRLGISRPQGGYDFYLSYNLSHVDATDIVEIPPTILSASPQARRNRPRIPSPGVLEAAVVIHSTLFNKTLYIWAARPMTELPTTFINRWAFMGSFAGSSGLATYDITTPFTNKFGFPADTEQVGIRTRVHEDDTLFSAFAQNTQVPT